MLLTSLFLTPEREAPPPPPRMSWLSRVNPRPNTGIPTDTLNVGQLMLCDEETRRKEVVCKGKTQLGTNPKNILYTIGAIVQSSWCTFRMLL